MLAEPRGPAGDRIGASVNLASGRRVPPRELEHVAESSLELFAIGCRQTGEPRHTFEARREVLDLSLPRENAVRDVPGHIEKVGIPQRYIVLVFPLPGAPAQAAPFVV